MKKIFFIIIATVSISAPAYAIPDVCWTRFTSYGFSSATQCQAACLSSCRNEHEKCYDLGWLSPAYNLCMNPVFNAFEACLADCIESEL